jgi:hypothetical protein
MNSLSAELHSIPLLQRQLDTTLQLVISLATMMTTDDIMLVRIRLTEANILLDSIMAERDNNASDGNSIPALPLLFTYFPIAESLSTECTLPASTPQSANAAASGSDGTDVSVGRTSRSRGSIVNHTLPQTIPLASNLSTALRLGLALHVLALLPEVSRAVACNALETR